MDSRTRPILFSTPMIRALLSGAKTQTRRVVKPQPEPDLKYGGYHWPSNLFRSMMTLEEMPSACPYGTRFDRLWVRETFADNDPPSGYIYKADYNDGVYAAFGSMGPPKWRPSIFMPRCASRITLAVSGVRVERLQDISEADAKAEGVDGPASGEWPSGFGSWTHDGKRIDGRPWAHKYLQLWMEINGHESAHANPWVWVVEFERIAPR